MIKAVFEMIVNIVKAIATSGASLLEKAQENFTNIETYKAAFEVAREFHKKHYNEDSFVHFMKTGAKKSRTSIDDNLIRNIYKSAKNTDWARLAMEMASKFDPIGIAKVIHSFIHDLC